MGWGLEQLTTIHKGLGNIPRPSVKAFILKEEFHCDHDLENRNKSFPLSQRSHVRINIIGIKQLDLKCVAWAISSISATVDERNTNGM